MPCNCKKPQPDYPEADSWGPVMWAILHALAEKSGNTMPCFRDDEKRHWIHLIHVLPKTIPCASCREHAEEWLLAHPAFNTKTVMNSSDLHEWIVDWFYDFHEAVNQRLEKQSFNKTLLTQTYGSVSITGALVALTPFIDTAIRLSGLTRTPWQTWMRHVKVLSSYY